MAKTLGIEFAPLSIPLERRLQMASVLLFTSLVAPLPVLCVIIHVMLLFTEYYWVAIGYGIWILYDVNMNTTSSSGGRRWDWFRKAAVWRRFRDYFPVALHKTGELAADRNYLMGYHPHGVLGCGAITNFATEATGFTDKIGVKPHLLTLKANFQLPIIRGLLLWLGRYIMNVHVYHVYMYM